MILSKETNGTSLIIRTRTRLSNRVESTRKSRSIDGAGKGVASCYCQNLMGNLLRDLLLRLSSARAKMRGSSHLGVVHELAVGDVLDGFLNEHIESSSPYLARV
tara:strand:+ start:634 stop:945 length:312 start_codon:yes stop_codon:yes gene_type:complete